MVIKTSKEIQILCIKVVLEYLDYLLHYIIIIADVKPVPSHKEMEERLKKLKDGKKS